MADGGKVGYNRGVERILNSKKSTVQEPAQGITLVYGDAITRHYKVECACSIEDHSVDTYITVNADEDGFDEIEVSFFVKMWTPFFNSFWERVKYAYNVLVHGVYTQQHDILVSKQTALNWVSAMEKGIADVEANQGKNNEG